MGGQDGLVRLKGSVGEITFYKTEDGYLARKKTVATSECIPEDPRFTWKPETTPFYKGHRK